MKTVIVAPHPDDEIIGCSEVFLVEKDIVIIYLTNDRKTEAEKFCEKRYISLFMKPIQALTFLSVITDPVYVPDPFYELHPLHKQAGAIGLLLKGESQNRTVVFYTTSMNAPYLHEVSNPSYKKGLLERHYPSQRDLWEYDHKYFLFEGRCQWLG